MNTFRKIDFLSERKLPLEHYMNGDHCEFP